MKTFSESVNNKQFLMYLDANNLYGWAMSYYLPHGEFEWVDDFNYLLDIENISDDSSTGYIYVVDLIYPHTIHDTMIYHSVQKIRRLVIPNRKNR